MASTPAGPIPADYHVRPFQPADAPGITACVRRVYGDSYVLHPELYQPEQIVQINQEGRLVSVVALREEEVVGHYGLERPELGPVAECGEAMVAPEHRHHHLFEQMHQVILDEARRLGLAGVFGQAVTNHPFTQRMYNHFAAHPCGIVLGLAPASVHNLPEPLHQRMSCILYFHYLQPPATLSVYAPPRHQGMLARIYQEMGIPVEFREGVPPDGPGQVDLQTFPVLRSGLIRVRRCGANTAAEILQARQWLRTEGQAEVVYLELPLAQAATPAVCEAAEAEGFFFGGVGPLFAADGDALRLQWLGVDLDLGQLQVESPFGQELLAYVAGERQRVGSSGAMHSTS